MTDPLSNPLRRPTDPSTTPPMTDEAVEKVWHWLDLMATSPGQNPDWALLVGVADMAREIDRARAAAEVCACVDCVEDRSDKEA